MVLQFVGEYVVAFLLKILIIYLMGIFYFILVFAFNLLGSGAKVWDYAKRLGSGAKVGV